MTKPSTSTIIVVAIASLIVVLLGFWLVPKIEFYTETEDLGFSAEAYQNPYLAAQQFLEVLAIPASSSDSLESMRELPSIETSLVIDDVSQVLSEERTYDLLEWVRSGGRLTIGARELEDDDVDYILREVEVEIIETHCNCRNFGEEIIEAVEDVLGKNTADRLVEEANRAGEEINNEIGEDVVPDGSGSVPEDQLTRMKISGSDGEFTLHFDANRGLNTPYWDWLDYAEKGETYSGYEPLYWAGSEYGEHLVQFEIGDGVLTILSDESVWFSDNLVNYDHAYLLWALHRNSNEVLFVYGSRMPGIFTLLWRNAPELVVAFLLLLFAWLIYRGRRFGPTMVDDRRHRRALLEHQRAVGQFMRQRGKADHLIEQMRSELRQRLQKRCPDFEEKTPRQQQEFVEQKLNLPASTLELALYSNDDLHAELFTQITAAIQTIRNRL